MSDSTSNVSNAPEEPGGEGDARDESGARDTHRSRESYRYVPPPDIPILEPTGDWIEYDDPIAGIVPCLFLSYPVGAAPNPDEPAPRDRFDTYPSTAALLFPEEFGDADDGADEDADDDTMPTATPRRGYRQYNRSTDSYTQDMQDPDGSIALRIGADFYTEGFETSLLALYQNRIDCFRVAEILYRHAAGRGNLDAFMNLGYVYGYDRCDGSYCHSAFDLHRGETQESRDALAYQCLERATHRRHNGEALYKLGDLVKRGRGCERDLARALSLYRQAFESSRHDSPRVWGSAALRLGDAYADGRGCDVDFAEALRWYRLADTGLTLAVDAGDTWYERPLFHARASIADMEQELGL